MLNKTIILFTLSLFTINNLYSQTIVPIQGPYAISEDNKIYAKDLNNDLNKFLGTWQYQSPEITFTVRLVRKNKVDLGYMFTDQVYGSYKIIKNGVTIIDNLQPIEQMQNELSLINDVNSSNYKIEIYGFTDSNTLKNLEGVIVDSEKSLLMRGFHITHDNSTGIDQLHWKHYIKINYSNDPNYFENRIPYQVTLTKID